MNTISQSTTIPESIPSHEITSLSTIHIEKEAAGTTIDGMPYEGMDYINLYKSVMPKLLHSLQTGKTTHPDLTKNIDAAIHQLNRPNTKSMFWIDNDFSVVIRELLTNAIESISKNNQHQGTIDLQAGIHTATNNLVLTIKDTGVGFGNLTVEDAFKPGTTTKQHAIDRSSIGNGLFRSKSFVEEGFGGTFKVFDNTADLNSGPGATVQITLPLKQ